MNVVFVHFSNLIRRNRTYRIFGPCGFVRKRLLQLILHLLNKYIIVLPDIWLIEIIFISYNLFNRLLLVQLWIILFFTCHIFTCSNFLVLHATPIFWRFRSFLMFFVLPAFSLILIFCILHILLCSLHLISFLTDLIGKLRRRSLIILLLSIEKLTLLRLVLTHHVEGPLWRNLMRPRHNWSSL